MRNSVFLLHLIIVFIVTANAQRRIYQPGNITIGVLISLHRTATIKTCGNLYDLGLGNYETISYAVAQINKNSRILRDVRLGIDVRDYCQSTVLAISEAYSLEKNNFLNDLLNAQGNLGMSSLQVESMNVTSPVAAVIGTEFSSSTSFVSRLLQVPGITIVSPFATSEELSSPHYSNFFRTIPSDGQQAKAMTDLIQRFGWQYVAIVAIDDSYGRYGVRALERESYNRKKFCIAMIEYLTDTGYKGRLKKIVQKLKRKSNITVIILWSGYTSARGFLEEASEQRLYGRTFLLSEGLATHGKDVLKTHSDILAGSFGIIPQHHEEEGLLRHLKSVTPADNPHNPLWKEFWKTTCKCTTDGPSNGFKLCDGNLTVGSRYKMLYSPYLPYLIDAVYALAYALDAMISCKGKDLYRVNCLELLRPDKLAGYMKNVSFQGVTGHVHFNDLGDPVDSHYDIVNFQQNQHQKWDLVAVGVWEGKGDFSKLVINQSLIQWGTENNAIPKSACSKTCSPGFKQTDTVECCWSCIECPQGFVNSLPGSRNCSKCQQEQMSNHDRTKCVDLPYINVQWNNVMAIISAVFGVLGIVGTLFTIGVFIFYRDTPIVKASNRDLSFVLLILILMCFVLACLHLSHPTNPLCLVIQPWRYITCTYCVSILYVKTNRLVSAFQTTMIPPWFKKYVLDRRRQHVVVFLLNVIQLTLTTLWLVLDPPYLYKDIKPQQHIFLTCQPCNTSVGYGIRSSMFAYLVFLSGLCTFYAFKARRLPENFNEAKFIGFAMYILLVSWVVYYPVDSTLEGAYHTFVACVTALLIAYGLLGCLFVPKVYVMLVCPDKNTLDSVKAEVGQFSKSIRSASVSMQIARDNRVSPEVATGTH